MELVVSNAERRALLHGESVVVPRVGDIYAALPGITGKIELEYEGEMRGADTVIREIIRSSVAASSTSTSPTPTPSRSSSGSTSAAPSSSTTASPSAASLAELKQIQGLFDKLAPFHITAQVCPETAVSAAEFLLEGMTAHKRISRVKSAASPPPRTEAQRRRQPVRRAHPRTRTMKIHRKNRSRRGFN